jgi:hypothetical protein
MPLSSQSLSHTSSATTWANALQAVAWNAASLIAFSAPSIRSNPVVRGASVADSGLHVLQRYLSQRGWSSEPEGGP